MTSLKTKHGLGTAFLQGRCTNGHSTSVSSTVIRTVETSMGQDTEKPGFTLPANVSNTALLWEVWQLLQAVITPRKTLKGNTPSTAHEWQPYPQLLASGLPTTGYCSGIERNGLTTMTPCVECDNRMLTERTAVKDHTMCIRDRTHQNRPITESRLVAGWGKIQATANRPELSLGVIRMFWS